MDRRDFLRVAGTSTALVALGALRAPTADAAPAKLGLGRFGALGPPDANGLMLPSGFSSRLLAEQGKRVGKSGYLWHKSPDGGAVIQQRDGGWVYTSNEEETPGGAGAIRFDRDGEIVDGYRILSGTAHNCAGGATPWGTWLSCEEQFMGRVWECGVGGPGQGIVRPLLGAFSHEAVAVDPIDHRLYMTEDAGSGDDLTLTWGRFYRFTPQRWRDDGRDVLDAGVLEAMVVRGDPYSGDGPWPVSWVIVDPFLTNVSARTISTGFKGGEGCFYDSGRVYFTTKGDNRVWVLGVDSQHLELLYDPVRLGDSAPLIGVDNVTVSRFGDVFVAEDGGNMELNVLSTARGALEVTPFMRITTQPNSEITGPAFDPSGTRLYFSSQRGAPGSGKGLTYEVAGPFGGDLARVSPVTVNLLPRTGAASSLVAAAGVASLAAGIALRSWARETDDPPLRPQS